MKIIETEFSGLFIIEPVIKGDHRGYFMESFLKNRFSTQISDVDFVQDNESLSKRGVVRGLHYQLPPYAQSKLIRVVTGRIIDVALDIRKGSPTFGRHLSVELSADNKLQLFIPVGFAHGFSVLEDNTIVQYKTDNYYAPHSEASILWNDPALAIDWNLDPNDIIISERDTIQPLFANATYL